MNVLLDADGNIKVANEPNDHFISNSYGRK